MKLKLIVFVMTLCSVAARGQRFHVELMAGVSNYQGDLLPIIFTFKQSQPAFNANVKYQLSTNREIKFISSRLVQKGRV